MNDYKSFLRGDDQGGGGTIMGNRLNTRRGFKTPISVQAERALERSLRPWRKLQESLKESIALSKQLNYTFVTATLEQQLEIVAHHLSPSGIHNSECREQELETQGPVGLTPKEAATRGDLF